MKNDRTLQLDIMDEVEFDPAVDAAGIGVAVSDGVATLTGRVPTYAARMSAERAAKRVEGVRAVANELVVELWPGTERDDTGIAEAAVHTLAWNTTVPSHAVTVTVDKGWVTLEGAVPWKYQKDAAYEAVARLTGVRGVTSLVTVSGSVHPEAVEKRIHSALQRSASLDADRIHAEAEGNHVTLRGWVRSWAEREDAENAAWSVFGVADVTNELTVAVEEPAFA
jgi:osmotically-inducible protein OsmY